jgi:hypothetical protein
MQDDRMVATQITGDRATLDNGEVVANGITVVITPCSIRFVEHLSPRAINGYARQYAIENGKIEVVDGSLGYRKGKAAVVCVQGGSAVDELVTIDDAGTCSWWKYPGLIRSHWTTEPITCAWVQHDGVDELDVQMNNEHRELTAYGDRLESKMFHDRKPNTVEKAYSDVAAAKAAANVHTAGAH